jgi:hypothetical protein
MALFHRWEITNVSLAGVTKRERERERKKETRKKNKKKGA